jgi:hypothetical protein
MSNWKLLNKKEYNALWKFVYEELCFNPYNDEYQKKISFPMPNISFDISNFYNENFSENFYETLHSLGVKWFKYIGINQKIYALNWQHDCYSFDPFSPFEKDEFNEWLIPLFPNGDYLFFISPDFDNGIFADGIDLKLYFWGTNMIDTYNKLPIELLNKNHK